MKPLFTPVAAQWSRTLRCMLASVFVLSFAQLPHAQSVANDEPSVVGFAIAAPRSAGLANFLDFMRDGLAANGVNTLVLRVDYNYAYTTYPQLRDADHLSKEQVKQMVAVAKEGGIRLIPQINLLGHQSWHGTLGNLLREFPEFDETPGIQLPETFVWPNPDGLYCKSYCPQHPGVHEVVFALVDELMDAFEADAFHPGLDEVFYIGHEQCERCRGMDPAGLFADEVARIHSHLKQRGAEMWMWGDRLIDGTSTGIGLWEASENGTHPAIDRIPTDIVICDWHYEQAVPTPAYFAIKGFPVVACPWNKPEVAEAQVKLLELSRANSPAPMRQRFRGVMQTVWSPAEPFVQAWKTGEGAEGLLSQIATFEAMIESLYSNP